MNAVNAGYQKDADTDDKQDCEKRSERMRGHATSFDYVWKGNLE